MGAVMLAWLAEVGILTARAVKGGPDSGTIAGIPVPSEYLASFAFYGVLGFAPKGSGMAKVAGVLAWGFTIATAMNFFNPADPVGAKASGSSSAKGQLA